MSIDNSINNKSAPKLNSNVVIITAAIIVFLTLILSFVLEYQLNTFSHPKIDDLEDSYNSLVFGVKQIDLSENKKAYYDHIYLLDSLINESVISIDNGLNSKDFHDNVFPTFSKQHLNNLNAIKADLIGLSSDKDSIHVFKSSKVKDLTPTLKLLNTTIISLQNRLKYQMEILKSVQFILAISFLVFFIFVYYIIKKELSQKNKLLETQIKLNKQIEEDKEIIEKAQDIANLGYYIYSFDSKSIWISERFKKILGIEKDVILVDEYFNFIEVGNRNLLAKRIKEVRDKNVKLDFTYKIINPQENIEKWIHHVSNPYKFDVEGKTLPVIGVIQDVTEQRNLEINYLKSSVAAQEAEKQSFGEALHDGISQILSAQAMYIDIINRLNSDVKLKSYIEKIKEFNQDAITDARNIAHGLMSKQLQKLGFIKAIEKICKDYTVSEKINFTYHNKGVKDEDMSETIRLNLYRIIQEISTNIMRHSMAKNATITLSNSNEGYIKIIIKDDGIGMDLEKIKKEKSGAGLQNIERRMQLLSGEVHLETSPNQGVCYTIKAPLYI